MQTTRTTTGYQLEGIEVDAKPYSQLPTQQARTLLFVAQGLPQKRIAQEMSVKVGTVKKYCSDLGFRFNTHTMRETVHQAIKQGVLRYTMCVFLCLLSVANQDVERSYRTIRNIRTVRTVRVRRLRELQNDLLAA
ncbi:MAG: LuxR C-terminal-related transcriptional regulator [Thalassotalea sp.]|nr:LuxR C-terminal-related transcriptional regulator [Thalassotalea sp.]